MNLLVKRSIIIPQVLKFYFEIPSCLPVAVAELVSPRARMVTGMVFALFFGGGIALLPAIAYFLRAWRDLQLTIGLASSLLLLYYWSVL